MKRRAFMDMGIALLLALAGVLFVVNTYLTSKDTVYMLSYLEARRARLLREEQNV